MGVAITDILTALFAQGATLFNIASSYLVSGEIPQRWGMAHATVVPYQSFKTRDEEYILVAVTSEKMWEKFCHLMGMQEFIHDPRFDVNKKRVLNREQLVPILEKKIAARNSDEWLSEFNKAGISCGRVNTMDRVFDHPQIKPRNMVVEVKHPTAGKIKLVGIPVKYSETPGSIRLPPPLLGQHTQEILSDPFGYSEEEIDALRQEGVI